VIAKTFEIRDAATFFGALAVKLEPSNEADRYLLARSGYGTEREEQTNYVLFMRLDVMGPCHYDPTGWPSSPRTMRTAHQYVDDHFDELQSGDVIDVEFILGETKTPKRTDAALESTW